MSTNKILTAGVIGGISFFLLGWVFYGMLLMNIMQNNSSNMANLQREPMLMWALALGNLAWGFLFAIVFGKWAGINTAVAGAKAAAIIGFLAMSFMDLICYGTMNFMTINCMLIDIATGTVIAAIGGSIIAAVLGSGSKTVSI